MLLDALYNEYASMVVGAFDAECARRGLDLICLAGGSLQSSAGYERQRNPCFELASTVALDGLVALNLNTTAPVMKDFLDSFHGLPICSVGIEVPGYSVVQADNAAGMRDAVLHLITVHNRRRIAFLRGPGFQTHPSSTKNDCAGQANATLAINPNTRLCAEMIQ